ncbi:MAG TPA: cellulase family glycosylhydrolase [Phycisphaerae bacterium]|nr:cellulase family glycosylhydrolase [Phycisphaerae bacterium]
MHNPLPRWRGFNLLDMYIYEPEREKIRAGDATGPGGYGGGEGDFRESDFDATAAWGFDFLRLPLDYRYWTQQAPPAPQHPTGWTPREEVLQRLDRALRLAVERRIHLSISLHRAPGYCVNPPAEPASLWTDPLQQQRFIEHWQLFAARYRGVPPGQLSFDLLNEPPAVGLGGILTGSGASRASHERVIRRAVGAIAAIDPARQVLANGLNYGNEPMPEFADLAPRLAQSCRAYLPFGVTHYKAHWVHYPWLRKPRWPGGDHFGRRFDLHDLESHYARWTALFARGIGVHCGEGGVFNQTPHDVALAWMRDTLGLLKRLGIGWALWNLRGDFGPLDNRRPDTPTEPHHGSQLDRAMLEILQNS